ncbi:hypothetical protein [Rhodococcus sp. NCIMB 12038]|uniref:hypothetical protein n=1 Tax=Rhodococcus sp. NCIMB 12038 TaxID=933800 RepID=UPI00211B183A|nr:hypothetical protein [Rhodococcus sp. NCIMB 12038]
MTPGTARRNPVMGDRCASKAGDHRPHVVILTNYGLDEYVFNALRASAAGFLGKDIVPEDFLHAVRVLVT